MSRALLAIAAAAALTGCVDQCRFLGETPAYYEAMYQREVPLSAFAAAFEASGWSAAAPHTEGTYGRVSAERRLNETVTLQARWGNLTPDASAGGDGFAMLYVWGNGTSFADDDDARAFLEPHLRAALDAVATSVGAADSEVWRGGARHCGAV